MDGKTNKEMAGLLGTTEATVKCHVSTILMRLNVSDRAQAVVNAAWCTSRLAFRCIDGCYWRFKSN